jgi:hypothetical protein
VVQVAHFPSADSMNRNGTPRTASSQARVNPVGPAPTISTVDIDAFSVRNISHNRNDVFVARSKTATLTSVNSVAELRMNRFCDYG